MLTVKRRWVGLLAGLGMLAGCEAGRVHARPEKGVERPSAGAWRQVSVGDDHVCAIDVDSVAWCWGDDGQGQLGSSQVTYSEAPIRVASTRRWRTISAGFRHTCGIDQDGQAWCWGWNRAQQTGGGASAEAVFRPMPV